jgi:photosystem II stability/assembly factor-like uncharacterized protein
MAASWNVIQKGFSAVTIGIGFQSDRIGWTSFTDGSSLPQIVKTADGGKTWNPIQNATGVNFLTTGVAAAKGYYTNVATAGILESDLWSVDGERFVQSIGAPIQAQDVKRAAGMMVLTGPKGPCLSKTNGATYSCITNVPLKNPGSGRYSSCPSKDVCYFTAGQWPSDSPTVTSRGDQKVWKLSHGVRVVQNADGSVAHELGAETLNDDPVTGYTAELWKTTDGGATWTNMISDEGNFYFNDVHCADEKTCVAVGEGFAQDGSASPGARIYLTTDGETFNLVHSEAAQGTESLMSARMLSATEYWAGGTTKAGGFMAPSLLIHSQDAGQTHTNEGSGITGQMITSMDFISPEHAYATSITALQVCNLLELGGSNPPAPTPTPTPGAGHYEKPPCGDDEAMASVTGTDGALCAPACSAAGECPTDAPDGVTAVPRCVLHDQSGNQFCALTCQSDDECDVAGGSHCANAGGGSVCVYPTSGAPTFLSHNDRMVV